jgi:hypothetical protein
VSVGEAAASNPYGRRPSLSRRPEEQVSIPADLLSENFGEACDWLFGAGGFAQCHLRFPRPGMLHNSWGSPPGLRGSPWTRSSPEESGALTVAASRRGRRPQSGGPPHNLSRVGGFSCLRGLLH